MVVEHKLVATLLNRTCSLLGEVGTSLEVYKIPGFCLLKYFIAG